MTGSFRYFVEVPRLVQTLSGEITYTALGITDAHNHVWIDPVPGAAPAAPILDQYDKIEEELKAFKAAGGESILDCQPAGCGRNANRLARLSRASKVNMIACTGFHRRKYFPPEYWLFTASSNQAAEFFLRELHAGLEEMTGRPNPGRAGFIKAALESTRDAWPYALLEGAAAAAVQAGSMIEVHTEKGELAEEAVIFFQDHGVEPGQLVLCHMDKRPDPGLHIALARAGVLLEYDTFYRPRYEPESRLWPLILKLVEAGFSDKIALATDMAEPAMYTSYSNGPGLASLPLQIQSRLANLGITANSIQQMLGGNIARRLAGLS